jgi:hypothetical protein
VGIGEHDEAASRMKAEGAGSRTNAPFIALVLGAIGSLAFLINAGRTTPKPLLLLMGLWVLSPFVALFAGNALSKRWSAGVQVALRRTIVVVAVGSIVLYALDTVRHIAGKPAAMYVLVPPVSWLLVAIVALSAFGSDKRSRRRVEVSPQR